MRIMNDDIRYLKTVADQIEYAMVEGRLKEYGIPIIGKTTGMGQAISVFTGKSPGGIAVYVPASAYDKVLEIMSVPLSEVPDEVYDAENYQDEEYLIEEEDEEQAVDNSSKVTVFIVVIIVVALVALYLHRIFE